MERNFGCPKNIGTRQYTTKGLHIASYEGSEIFVAL